ncbi:WxL domain-containing protein [Enterococcus rotai]|uniref:WxL domain-containing protein n=1 Tax=Enterococcus rotai TaxID=118060 RepID=UPI0035C73EEE
MKNTHKLLGAALLAAVGVSVAIPNTTKAAPDSKTGDGYIEFTRDATGGTTITKPGETGSIITNITGVEKKEFGVVAITPLDFKSHKILSDGSGRDYPVKPFHANPGSTSATSPEFKQANFVKYTDDRSTLDHKYKLSGKITSNFTTTLANGTDTAELNGAEITFSDLSLKSIADPALRPAASALKAGPHVLKAKNGAVEANSVDFVVNEDPTKGRGDYELVFGDAAVANSAENAVKLSVPSTTEIMHGKYKAVITWTLSDTI